MAGLPVVVPVLVAFGLAVERGLDVVGLRDDRCRLRAADLLACLGVYFVDESAQRGARVRRVVAAT